MNPDPLRVLAFAVTAGLAAVVASSRWPGDSRRLLATTAGACAAVGAVLALVAR